MKPQPSALRLVPRLPKLPNTKAGENGNNRQLLHAPGGKDPRAGFPRPRSPFARASPASAEPEAAAASPGRHLPGPLRSGAPAASGRTERPGRAPGQVREPPAALASSPPARQRLGHRGLGCGCPERGDYPAGASPRRGRSPAEPKNERV